MSTDQFDPRSENINAEIEAEDPLAELARIVAGEDENAPEVAAPVKPPIGDIESSLETNLMEELAVEQVEVAETDEFAASIQEQMEAQMAANDLRPEEVAVETIQQAPEFEPVLEESPVSVTAEPAIEVAHVDEETAFQDDLIEALQEEIHPPQPVSEPESVAFVAPETEEFDSVPQVVEHEFEAPVIEDIPIADVPIAEQAVPETEIDFSSAFAEELGVENVDEAQGWAGADQAPEVDDFALAAQSAGYQPIEEPLAGNPEYQSEPEVAVAELNAEGEQSSGGGMKYAMAALVIALFAGVITAGYGFLGGGSGNEQTAEQANIIKADADPVKEKPENPGGRVPDNQDKASYGKVEGIEESVNQSTLVSSTEQPALIDTTNASPEAIEQAETSLAANGNNGNKLDDRLAGGTSEDSALTNSNPSVEPKVVKTLVIKPDGTVVDGASSSLSGNQQFAASSSDLGLTRVSDATTRSVATTTVKPNEPIDGAKSTQDIGVPSASPLPKPEPAAEAPKPQPVQQATATQTQLQTTQPVARSEWVVQVASQTSPEAAQTSFQRMRQQYSALQNRSMSVQRAAVNGKTYYRVRVQTASRNDANQLCSRLTSQGGSCFVTR